MSGFDWIGNPDADELLRSLWGTMHIWQIAERMTAELVVHPPLTRNAITGRAMRLNLPPIKAAAPPRVPSAPKPPDRRKSPLHGRRMADPFMGALGPPKEPAPVVLADPNEVPKGAKKLMALKNNMCRYPYEIARATYLFCASTKSVDVTKGVPYCPPHARLCFYRP